MKKELLVIRKDKERSASCNEYEGHIALKRYVIADDLVSTGSTCVRIIRAIKELISPDAILVGILLYSDGDAVNFYPAESDRVKNTTDSAADSTFIPFR
jgi:orotate phosphoribosyltransferase-like protein